MSRHAWSFGGQRAGTCARCACIVVLLSSSLACGASGSGPLRSESPAVDASQLFARASELAAGGEWVRAEQFLLAAADAGLPREAFMPALLRACLEAGRPRRALMHIDRALRTWPDDAQLWAMSGALLWAMEQTGDAQAHLERALQLPDPPSQVHYWLARVWLRLGEREQAHRALERYLEQAPDGNFAARARWWLGVPQPHSPGVPSHVRQVDSEDWPKAGEA